MSSTLTRWLYISSVFIAAWTPAAAQITQSARLEIPFLKNEIPFEIIPAQEKGIFLYRRVPVLINDDQIEIARLDTAFQQQWHGYVSISSKSILVGKRAANNHVYFLARHQDYTKNDFELIAIDQDSATYVRQTIKNFIAFTPMEFQITPFGLLIGGYYNRVPVVIFYSLETQKSRILPGLMNESGELDQIKTYPDGSFDVLISAKNFMGIKTIWIKNYDAQADLIRNYALDPEDNKHLIFARSLKTGNDMQMVAGVFGTRNSEFSRGMFLSSIDLSGLEQLRYYNYADLENFFKYMKAKREQRVKERIERRKIRGKKIRFNYRFMVHEIVPYKDQYVLLGEAFYPRYVTVDRASTMGFFSPSAMSRGQYIRDGRVFDGYYYTHAVVMGFDKNGKLLWDNSFEINDVRTFTLEQFVKLEVKEDKIVLLYVYENELRSKIIKDNQVLEGKTRAPIKTTIDTDVIKKESDNVAKLDYWYGDYFYAFGVQEIMNEKSGKRRVFFINKVSYE